MHKFYLISLFLFSPLAAMLNPATPSSDGICHLARLPREIRDQIAQYLLYETDQEFVARALKNYSNERVNPLLRARNDRVMVYGSQITKFSATKSYEATIESVPTSSMPVVFVFGTIGDARHSFTISFDIISKKPDFISFNKQATKILVLDAQGTIELFTISKFFLALVNREKSIDFKELFLRKLVCKKIENSKGPHA